MAENIPGSADQVKMTAVHPLQIIIEEIRREIPDAKYVYDEALSYETAVKKYRDNNNLNETSDDVFPLFAFRRSVLRTVETEAPMRRATSIFTKALKPSDPNTALSYRMLHGAFDLEFLYMDKDLDQIERYEITYLSEEGISGIKKVVADLPDPIGPMEWYLQHQPLNDKQFESEGNFYKAAGGTIKVTGFYLVLRGEIPLILTINAVLKDLVNKDVIYGSETIEAPE